VAYCLACSDWCCYTSSWPAMPFSFSPRRCGWQHWRC